jgi:hypothetical protein
MLEINTYIDNFPLFNRVGYSMNIPKKYQDVYNSRNKFEEVHHTIETVRNLPKHAFRIIDKDSLIMDGVGDSPNDIPEFMIIGTCKILNVPCGCYFRTIDTSPWYRDPFEGWRMDSSIVVDSCENHSYSSPKEEKGYFIRDCTKCSIAAGYIASGELNK